jgi:hypothetical protein
MAFPYQVNLLLVLRVRLNVNNTLFNSAVISILLGLAQGRVYTLIEESLLMHPFMTEI